MAKNKAGMSKWSDFNEGRDPILVFGKPAPINLKIDIGLTWTIA